MWVWDPPAVGDAYRTGLVEKHVVDSDEQCTNTVEPSGWGSDEEVPAWPPSPRWRRMVNKIRASRIRYMLEQLLLQRQRLTVRAYTQFSKTTYALNLVLLLALLFCTVVCLLFHTRAIVRMIFLSLLRHICILVFSFCRRGLLMHRLCQGGVFATDATTGI